MKTTNKQSTAARDFTKPTPVDDVFMVFPANVRDLMPAYVDIPAEFRDWNSNGKWNRLQSDWFGYGLDDLKLYPKEGIDPDMAWRHLRAIQGSFQPKHEHKMAAVAYLASLWFTDATWKRATKP